MSQYVLFIVPNMARMLILGRTKQDGEAIAVRCNAREGAQIFDELPGTIVISQVFNNTERNIPITGKSMVNDI